MVSFWLHRFFYTTSRYSTLGKFTARLAKTPEGISDAARRVAPVELADAVGESQILNPDAVARTDVTLEYGPTVGRDGIDSLIAGAPIPGSQLLVGGCPASTIFAGWRQSVLPVHLLGLAPLLGSVGPVAGDVKLQDDGVVHDPVNRRGGGHGVGKDALPLREDQV